MGDVGSCVCFTGERVQHKIRDEKVKRVSEAERSGHGRDIYHACRTNRQAITEKGFSERLPAQADVLEMGWAETRFSLAAHDNCHWFGSNHMEDLLQT